MKTHLNTLFVTLEGAYLRKDGEAVEIRHEGETKLRVPLHNLDGIVTMGWDISLSAALMAACAEGKISLSLHNAHGKFLAAVNGFTSGNILLRREQYRRADHEPASLAIAANMIAAKILNSRTVLMRAIRDHGDKDVQRSFLLQRSADALSSRIGLTRSATSLDTLRGVEGEAAVAYFAAFPSLFTNHDPALTFDGRSRRPPLIRSTACSDFSTRC